jgi:hypothetical protein
MVEQQISLEKYGRPERGPIFEIKNEYVIPKTREAAEEKSIIFMETNCGHKASLFTRKVELFCLPTLIGFDYPANLSYADIYSVAWSTLRDRGFNVVPTVREIDQNKVATTDLCADEITSVYDQKIDVAELRDPFPMDKEFIKIPNDKIRKEAEILLNMANRKGVELMSDGPFHIVVRGDGSWYLMPLDIGKIRIYAKEKDMPRNSKLNNISFIRGAVTAFDKVQNNIRALREARGLV